MSRANEDEGFRDQVTKLFAPWTAEWVEAHPDRSYTSPGLDTLIEWKQGQVATLRVKLAAQMTAAKENRDRAVAAEKQAVRLRSVLDMLPSVLGEAVTEVIVGALAGRPTAINEVKNA